MQRYDEAKKELQNIVDMPDRDINMILIFLHQNKGVFPKRRRDQFPKLNDSEIEKMQVTYRSIYEMDEHQIDFSFLSPPKPAAMAPQPNSFIDTGGSIRSAVKDKFFGKHRTNYLSFYFIAGTFIKFILPAPALLALYIFGRKLFIIW